MFSLRLICISIFCLSNLCASAQDTFVLHFLYGSKPARGYKRIENKWFGGIHGGHVYMQLGDEFFSFYPSGRFHIFPYPKNRHSTYVLQSLSSWQRDTVGMKVSSIYIPITASQRVQLLALKARYAAATPYDYAFLGMRCASAAYDVLGQIGIAKARKNAGNVCRHFYPRPLRKKMYRLAEERGYKVERKKGKKSRKWERDGGKWERAFES